MYFTFCGAAEQDVFVPLQLLMLRGIQFNNFNSDKPKTQITQNKQNTQKMNAKKLTNKIHTI